MSSGFKLYSQEGVDRYCVIKKSADPCKRFPPVRQNLSRLMSLVQRVRRTKLSQFYSGFEKTHPSTFDDQIHTPDKRLYYSSNQKTRFSRFATSHMRGTFIIVMSRCQSDMTNYQSCSQWPGNYLSRIWQDLLKISLYYYT